MQCRISGSASPHGGAAAAHLQGRCTTSDQRVTNVRKITNGCETAANRVSQVRGCSTVCWLSSTYDLCPLHSCFKEVTKKDKIMHAPYLSRSSLSAAWFAIQCGQVAERRHPAGVRCGAGRGDSFWKDPSELVTGHLQHYQPLGTLTDAANKCLCWPCSCALWQQ